MQRAHRARWVLPLAALAGLYGCGGGGGSGSTTTTATTWTAGVFQPASKFAALCAAPRSGTDPYHNNQPYPDRQGTTTDENNWLRSWTHQLYLWYDEVQDADPSLTSTTAQYFQLMKTTQTTSSGAPKDRFHFTYPTSTWDSLEQAGVEVGYGLQWEIVQATAPRSVRIAYLESNLPASTASQNLVRGDTVLTVDGADLVNATDQASLNTINAGLSPAKAGESHTFTVEDPGSSTPRTVTLQAVNETSTPVLLEKTLAGASGGTVGYILYNDQIDTAESELITAINNLKSAGVTDLILDLRYNGGGLLDLASELGYMIGGNQTAGQTFELQQFNNQYTTTNPVTGSPITPTLFHSTTQGFSTTAGQPLPTLNLMRVLVITGQDTCSASESIINGLQGVGVTVYQIGSTTCGKPYGFYPQDNCGTTYFSIQFQGVNAKGFGGYGDGFSPANTTPAAGVSVPGCSVADDFNHALGDPAEGRIATALAYLANPTPATCPPPPVGKPPPAALSQRQLLERIFVRSPLRQMRILRR
ncbi:MAG: peptidase [Gammaproteobacteria bacterium]|nr:peptidase [Gammaproteobacteria bacterium]